jgi:hypothetical protein
MIKKPQKRGPRLGMGCSAIEEVLMFDLNFVIKQRLYW